MIHPEFLGEVRFGSSSRERNLWLEITFLRTFFSAFSCMNDKFVPKINVITENKI